MCQRSRRQLGVYSTRTRWVEGPLWGSRTASGWLIGLAFKKKRRRSPIEVGAVPKWQFIPTNESVRTQRRGPQKRAPFPTAQRYERRQNAPESPANRLNEAAPTFPEIYTWGRVFCLQGVSAKIESLFRALWRFSGARNTNQGDAQHVKHHAQKTQAVLRFRIRGRARMDEVKRRFLGENSCHLTTDFRVFGRDLTASLFNRKQVFTRYARSCTMLRKR